MLYTSFRLDMACNLLHHHVHGTPPTLSKGLEDGKHRTKVHTRIHFAVHSSHSTARRHCAFPTSQCARNDVVHTRAHCRVDGRGGAGARSQPNRRMCVGNESTLADAVGKSETVEAHRTKLTPNTDDADRYHLKVQDEEYSGITWDVRVAIAT